MTDRRVLYAELAKLRRFVVFVGDDIHTETVCSDHARHVERLLKADGEKNVNTHVRDGNQDNLPRLPDLRRWTRPYAETGH